MRVKNKKKRKCRKGDRAKGRNELLGGRKNKVSSLSHSKTLYDLREQD